MVKKTLGQHLSELSNPNPKDYDPEALAPVSSDEGSDQDDHATDHYLNVG